MKQHFAWVRPGPWGSTRTGPLCGRLSNQTADGFMNITDVRDEVTCKFCRKHYRFDELAAEAEAERIMRTVPATVLVDALVHLKTGKAPAPTTPSTGAPDQ